MSVRRVIGLVPTLSALASVLVVAFALNAYVASQRTEHVRALHLLPAADAGQRLFFALLDQESSLRGFVITGDVQFLVQYDEERLTEELEFDRLDTVLVGEYPELHAVVERLRDLARDWRREAATPEIDLVRDGRLAEAAEIVATGEGRAIFDELQRRFDGFRTAIEVARAENRRDLDVRSDRLFVATLVGAAVAIAAASLTWLGARRRIAEPLERLADQAASVASGRLDTHITPGGPTEIDTVARSVEQMRVQLLGEVARAFASGMVEAEEAERGRLAGELHDDPIQVLTSAQWQLEALTAGLADSHRPAATAIATSLADVQVRLRTLMFRLHPPGLDDEGLATALDDLLLDTFDDTDVEVHLTVDLRDALLPAGSTLAYRIAAEAIRNVRKHAGATSIDVSVRTTGDGVQMSIIDDGRGTTETLADVRAPSGERGERRAHHQGTSISRALAVAAGGWWQQSSRPGTGTTVTCWLPAAFVDPPQHHDDLSSVGVERT